MAGYNFKSETEVKEFLKNLGIEYRFGCYSEKNPEVCHLLADYLEAIDKDFKKAAKLYQTTCDEHKYAHSCHKFGGYAALGKGLRARDEATALKYFTKGCEWGYVDSCLHQGLMLVAEQNGRVQQDVLKGMEMLEKACEGKNAQACYFLSGMYIAGVRKGSVKTSKAGQNEALTHAHTYLVAKDMARAFKFAEMGCNLGNMYSCVNLSQMYRKGDGVAKNAELADKYRKIAVEMQEEMQSNKTLQFQKGLSN